MLYNFRSILYLLTKDERTHRLMLYRIAVFNERMKNYAKK
jgi:hypothetical protein